MSEITLNTVRLYTEDDFYDVNTDNRPLADIMSNVTLINKRLGKLGYYIEAKANPETEPVGGFSPNVCACIRENGLLYPIDITKSMAEVDYKKYPIVLVLETDTTTGVYKCLSFAILYKLCDNFKPFLTASVGNTVKVGLGGQLIDSFYFDQYYSGKTYQDLVVGKVASSSEITFGGNQVSVLGDNAFLAKNRDDSTSGLLTVVRDNKESNVVSKSIILDSVGSPYVFSEVQNSFRPEYSNTQLPVPVYFTNSSIIYNQATGEILDVDLESKLNELHFKSPIISATNSQDVIYNTAGVTVSSLLDFSNRSLLHNASYSTALTELSQDVSSALTFTFTNDDQRVLGTEFPSVSRSIGNSIVQSTGIPSSLLPTSDNKLSGVLFGNYDTLGAYIGTVADNPLGIQRPTVAEEDALAESTKLNTIRLSDLYNSSTLLIHAKSDDTDVLSNLVCSADGYIVLSGTKGVHVNKQPTLDSELANKKYVDLKISSVTDSAIKKIPLSGTVKDDPIKGLLEFDVSENGDSQSSVLKFTGLDHVDILSNTPIRLINSGNTQNSTVLQQLKLYTSSTLTSDDAGWDDSEAVNKLYLKSYVNNLLSGAAATNPYVTISGNDLQSITGKKRFTKDLLLDSALVLNSLTPVVSTGAQYLEFNNTDVSKSVKLKAGETVDTDDDSVLTSKGYVDTKIDTIKQLLPTTWAAWGTKSYQSGGILSNASPDSASSLFNNYVSVTTTPDGNVFSVSKACTLHIKFSGLLNASDYLVKLALLKNGMPVATTGAGSSTTAAGIVSGYWPLDIDTIITCAPSDTFEFSIIEKFPVKSSGTITSFDTYGHITVIN